MRLGLERLIDKRFQGVAKGVGTQKIIGRVHQAPIRVAGCLMPCMITVLEKEQDMDFIFGLDMVGHISVSTRVLSVYACSSVYECNAVSICVVDDNQCGLRNQSDTRECVQPLRCAQAPPVLHRPER
jgi:hypothetical protein